MLDLEPATRVLTGIVAGVRDEQLTVPTPCAETSLGALLDHVDGLSLAFTAAATKTPLDGGRQGPSADVSRLGSDWRTRIPQRLAALASAWREQSAWTGMTQAGGLDLPAEVAGIVALDEVIARMGYRRRERSELQQRAPTADGCIRVRAVGDRTESAG
ncbi:MAG TPA: TIGR03086 family metal-binding protein [Pseudonocardiaceae bacterium]|jgi:uncharacterized protein (TIGR03086 family)